MTRTTAALFIPLFESVALSLICYFAMHAFFSSTVALDFTATMRTVIFSSLVLTISTCFLHLAISAAQKTDQIVVAYAATAVAGRRQLLSYRHALAVSNAYCCAAALLLLQFVVMFMQATVYSSQLDASPAMRGGNKSHLSSQQVEWMHAVVGASGGWILSPEKGVYMAPSPVAAPFMGSIYAGIILAYLVTMFLISIYISYMATPELASSYLFMEPRFLVIASGFLSMSVGQSVSGTFASCGSPVASIAGFVAFVLGTCFFDVPFAAFGSQFHTIAKWIGLQTLAILPLFFFLSGNVPSSVKTVCSILVVASSFSNLLDLIFTDWNSSSDGHDPGQAAMITELPMDCRFITSLGSSSDAAAVAAAAAASPSSSGTIRALDCQQQQQQQLLMRASASSSAALGKRHKA